MVVSRFTSCVEDCAICCYQVRKNSARGIDSPVRLLQVAPVILVRLQKSQFWSFGRWVKLLCSRDATFCRTFRIWVVRNLCGCRYSCDLEVLCAVLQPFRKILHAVSSCSVATVLWCSLVTSWICWIQLARWTLRKRCRGRSLCWNLMIVQGLPREPSSQSSRLWSDVAFDHWPTHKCIRALRRAYLMIGRQACHRAMHSYEKIKIVNMYLCFLDLRRVSSSPELKPFLHRRSGVDHEMCLFRLSNKVPALPRLRQESGTHLLLSKFLFNVSAGASLLFAGFVLRPFFEFWSPRNSLQRFAFLHDSLRWTLSFRNFYVTHRALGEFDGVIRFQISIFPKNRLFLRATLGHTTQFE